VMMLCAYVASQKKYSVTKKGIVINRPFWKIEASRLLTVPYRAFALLVCLITIFLNVRSKFTLKPILKVLSIFWLLLLVRFAYDMYYRTDIFIFRDQVNQTWLYMVAMTIIPMYSIMKSYRNIDFYVFALLEKI
jgi:hypothetical protein